MKFLVINFIIIIYSSLLFGQTITFPLKNDKKVRKNDCEVVDSSKLIYPSVLNKGDLGVEGIKDNNYVSLATYWWPDSLSRSRIYIAHDGKTNPEVYQVGNLKDLLLLKKNIKLLNDCYKLGYEKEVAFKVEKLLTVWFVNNNTKMAPNFENAQLIKGKNLGRLEGIIEARHFIDIISNIVELRQVNLIDDRVYYGVVNWFRSFYDWMETQEQDGSKVLTNNIGTSFFYQKLVYLTFTYDRESKFFKSELDKISLSLSKLLNNQFDNQGKQKLEVRRANPIIYSKSNIGYWEEILSFINTNGLTNIITTDLVEKIEKGTLYIENYRKE